MLPEHSLIVPPSARTLTNTGIRSSPPSTSSFVTARLTRPFTRTAIRSITRSSQPTRRGLRVVVPYSPPPRSRRYSAVSPSTSVGNGPVPTRDVKAFASRVGTGPYPTEVEGDTAEYLRERGG